MENIHITEVRLSSEEILNLPKETVDRIVTNMYHGNFPYAYRYSKDTPFNESDKIFYSKLVNNYLTNKEINCGDVDYDSIKFIGLLEEDFALSLLQKRERFTSIAPYDLPQSHIEFFNSLSDDIKTSLKGTFLEKYINIIFVPKTKRQVYEAVEYEGEILLPIKGRNDFVLLGNSTNIKFGFWSDYQSFAIKDMETANKLAEKLSELTHIIEVRQEFLKWGLSINSQSFSFFNTPKIVPVLEGDSFTLSVSNKTESDEDADEDDYSEANIFYFDGYLVDFVLEGDLDNMFYAEHETFWSGEHDERYRNFIKAAKELNIPYKGGRVPKGKYKILADKVYGRK